MRPLPVTSRTLQKASSGAVGAPGARPLPVPLPALPSASTAAEGPRSAAPESFVDPLRGRRVRVVGVLGGEWFGVLLGVTKYEIKLELVDGKHVVLLKHAVAALEVRE